MKKEKEKRIGLFTLLISKEEILTCFILIVAIILDAVDCDVIKGLNNADNTS